MEDFVEHHYSMLHLCNILVVKWIKENVYFSFPKEDNSELGIWKNSQAIQHSNTTKWTSESFKM